MTVTHMSVISVPVSDQDAARSFYTEKLGWDLLNDSMFEQGGQRLRWLQVAPKGATTSIILTNWLPQLKPGGFDGVLTTTDIHADMKTLQDRGVTFRGPVFETDWGQFVGFTDPDGNSWQLNQEPKR